MSDTCPILTPEEARCTTIIDRAQRAMLDKISAAIGEAHEVAAREIGSGETGRSLPSRDYFTAVAHHDLFLQLCKANRQTSKDGLPHVAAAILRNFQGLAKTWERAPAG